jgi:hypothetical protein
MGRETVWDSVTLATHKETEELGSGLRFAILRVVVS